MKKTEILASMRRTLKVFYIKNSVIEIRILGTNRGTVCGYYDDMNKLLSDIEPYVEIYPIYITLNRLKGEVIARSSNKLKEFAKNTSGDSDIKWLRFLHIDIDSVRLAGISATDEELMYAREKAYEVKEFLEEKGIYNPIIACSGNGYNLDYRLDLENTKENVEYVRNTLRALDLLFSDEKAKVDTTTYNPGRIIKLFGSLSCKGEHTEDRPHRYSFIEDIQEETNPITIEQMKEIINVLPDSNKNSQVKDSINVEEWLDKRGIVINKVKHISNGTMYILETCPWNENHTNYSAYVIQFDTGAIIAKCHHESCKEHNWKTLKALFGEDNKGDENSGEEVSIADILVGLAMERAELFSNEIEEGIASFKVGEHTENAKIRGSKFKKWLTKLYFDLKGKAIKADTMNQAINLLESIAVFKGESRKLEKRVTKHQDDMYYDLADKNWRVIKISKKDCTLIEKPPALFTRAANMKEQAIPDFNTKPTELIAFVDKHFRFKEYADKVLFAVYLVNCLVADIPHPILVLFGEKGAAKSTTMRMVRSIVDPAKNDLLSLPTSKSDLALSLSSNYMPTFDNLDVITAEKSDMLCMAATGGAFSRRMLYTDEDEVIISFKRCVVLNGINVVATRADLLDRSIVLELERINEGERRTEKDVWNEFEEDKPKILGACFNALSYAVNLHPTVNLTKLGRMADFTTWGYAIAEAIGIGGEEFLQSYLNNQRKANEVALTSNPLAVSVLAFMRKRKSWEGSVAELLGVLREVGTAENINIQNRAFPNASNVLSMRLKEIKSNLEQVGITYEIRHAGNYKKITLQNLSLKE